jgi:hypothetical protein
MQLIYNNVKKAVLMVYLENLSKQQNHNGAA